MPKECLVRFPLQMRPEERDALERLADGKPIANFLRDLVNEREPGTFAPTVRGRRWPENPQDRHLRRTA
jgi:hypothetical protein